MCYPHKFSTISRCGVNGHLAFGMACAASWFRSASCAPVIRSLRDWIPAASRFISTSARSACCCSPLGCCCNGWQLRKLNRNQRRRQRQRDRKMFDESNIIAGLEIGTSKICVVVGEQNADGALNIIGVGQSPSRGVRKGEIINPTDVEEDLRTAVAEAEQMADVETYEVKLLGTAGQ